MGKRAFRVAYDGRSLHGFQRQPNVPTVEGAIFDALAALGVHDPAESRPTGYTAAGRTDAGVSAIQQTVSVTCPDWLSPTTLNDPLPQDVCVWASADVPEEFHARFDAISRTYRYHLYSPDASIDRARWVSDAIVGTHDFHNLTGERTSTRRTIDSATVEMEGEYLVLQVRSKGFLHQFVRRFVGLIRLVVEGERPRSFVDRVLSDEELTGQDGIAPESAHPLVLTEVEYPNLSFESDEGAVHRARNRFDQLHIDLRTTARVVEELTNGIS